MKTTPKQPTETRIPLIATVAAIAVSVAVALPAQALWFLDKLVGRRPDGRFKIGPDPQTLMALSSPVLVEGMTWVCAILYVDSVKRGSPQRLYRLLTFVFSLIAASINFSHGWTISPVVGVVFAMASLMAVGAWELYMLRERHLAAGMTGEEIKLWTLRWRKHPKVMREVGRIRATFGVTLPREVAWRMAYVRKIGNPTVPVAVSDDLIDRIFVRTTDPKETETTSAETASEATETGTASSAEPELTTASGGTVAVAEVVELPVGWDRVSSADEMIRRFWPELGPEFGAELENPESSGGEFRNSGTNDAGTRPKPRTPEQGVSSKVPTRKRNSERNRNSGRVQFQATKVELFGEGDVKARMLRYFARAERNNHALAELDRGFIAEQFGVSDRHVRNTIALYQDPEARKGDR